MCTKNLMRRQVSELFKVPIDDLDNVKERQFSITSLNFATWDLETILMLQQEDHRVRFRKLMSMLLVELIDQSVGFVKLEVLCVEQSLTELNWVDDVIDEINTVNHLLCFLINRLGLIYLLVHRLQVFAHVTSWTTLFCNFCSWSC